MVKIKKNKKQKNTKRKNKKNHFKKRKKIRKKTKQITRQITTQKTRQNNKRKRNYSKELSSEKLINLAHNKRNNQENIESNIINKDIVKKHLLTNNFNKNKKYFIMLHVSWCPHCTQALPSFLDARKQLINEPNICMEEYECDEHPELKKLTNGFPSFIKVINGNTSNYTGRRDIQDFINEIL